MRRILAATGVAFLVGVLLAPAALAGEIKLKFGPELTRQACGGGTLVINVEQQVLNDADSGVGGNNWALDRYERHIKVWQTGPNTFCATLRYEGEFTTFAGTSPGATGTVDAGVTGEMAGGYRATFTATLLASPAYPTRGDIGTFDYGCNAAGTCPGLASWPDFYFAGWAGDFDYAWWGWIYHAGHNGTWVNAITGNLGDITGSPHRDDDEQDD